MNQTLIRPGKNCWRRENCGRAAFLIDGAAYFSALAATLVRARHAVYIVGWDIDSRIRLVRDGTLDDFPPELGPFLDALTRRRKELHIYVLDWDFAMLYSLDREPLPIFKLGWRTHGRLHFRMDAHHPVGASHHQKLVVVDDQLAFCGGLDLARNRWDTPAHDPLDGRRQDGGISYPPFHDVQMMVDGDTAEALGELARQRWARATGETLQSPPVNPDDLWPAAVVPDLKRVSVAILRTSPEYRRSPGIREVKRFYLDAIASARDSIYIENQYLTAWEIGEALASRLREKLGPEVILVLPRECSGWLEETTMGAMRARLLKDLHKADRFGRLRVYYPIVRMERVQTIMVHAKVLVVDDRLVRVGSSNLNNRSMGLDTECDLGVEVDDPAKRERIADFRNRLLAEHLGAKPAEVAKALVDGGSLISVIEGLRGKRRSLEVLEVAVEPWLGEMLPDSQLLDPERPVTLDKLVDLLAPEEGKSDRGLVFGLVLMAALALAALWQWTPLSGLINVDALVAWGTALRSNPGAPLFVVGTFVLGGLVLFPVTLLILASALAFGPVAGFAYSLCGALISSLSTFGIGRLLGRDRVRQLAGGRLNRISRWLTQRGIVTVAAVHLMPVAPFSMVNLVAGASHIRLRDFVFGTLFGMLPGILAISLFEEGVATLIEDPRIEKFLVLALLILVFSGGVWGLRRWLRRLKAIREAEDDG